MARVLQRAGGVETREVTGEVRDLIAAGLGGSGLVPVRRLRLEHILWNHAVHRLKKLSSPPQ